jgi:hypothetical protein
MMYNGSMCAVMLMIVRLVVVVVPKLSVALPIMLVHAAQPLGLLIVLSPRPLLAIDHQDFPA